MISTQHNITLKKFKWAHSLTLLKSVALAVVTIIFSGGTAVSETIDDLTQQVRSAEIAFAQSMADRNLNSFSTFLADEAIFFDGPNVLRGKEAITTGWSIYFETEKAPFSWKPEMVEVLESGLLALSTGPVISPDGIHIGTFNSIWRLENDGNWKVVFDKGCPHCK